MIKNISQKEKLFFYDGKKQFLYSVTECFVLYLIFLFIRYLLHKDSRGFLYLDMYMFMIYIMSSSGRIFQRQGQYMTFGYCRKTLFHLQISNILLCSIVWGSFRSITHVVNYSHIVQDFIEDTKELPSMYHMPHFAELLIIDILCFFMLSLFILWDSTKLVPFFFYNSTTGRSLYVEQQVKEKKENRTLIGKILFLIRKILGFSFMIAFAVSPIFFFQIQLQKPLTFRLFAYLLIAAATLLFFLLAKRRFSPKYL